MLKNFWCVFGRDPSKAFHTLTWRRQDARRYQHGKYTRVLTTPEQGNKAQRRKRMFMGINLALKEN